MGIKRIFHPIGQGGFYSEHFGDVTPTFTVVYDCGSLTLSDKQLKTKVNSSFEEGSQIDILFISHFHADHINGIDHLKKRCTIKNVVIPYLDDEAKALLKVSNFVETRYVETEIIDNPESFFGQNTRIFRVRATEGSESGGINFDNAINIDPHNDTNATSEAAQQTQSNNSSTSRGQEINSGTAIASQSMPFWFYVPYNFEQSTRSALFITELTNLGLSITDIDTIENILKHKDRLIIAYKKVTSDLNKNSLLVYSGPKEPDLKVSLVTHKYRDLWFWPRHHYDFNSGCLYCGDADLNENGLVNYLLTSLNPIIALLATIVVPHHGAIKNHNKALFAGLTGLHFCIASYGTTNTYGHPSDFVIADIISPASDFIAITENQESLAVFKQY